MVATVEGMLVRGWGIAWAGNLEVGIDLGIGLKEGIDLKTSIATCCHSFDSQLGLNFRCCSFLVSGLLLAVPC